jgi:hypothetical protein
MDNENLKKAMSALAKLIAQQEALAKAQKKNDEEIAKAKAEVAKLVVGKQA